MFSGQAPKALCWQNCLLITQKDTKKRENNFFDIKNVIELCWCVNAMCMFNNEAHQNPTHSLSMCKQKLLFFLFLSLTRFSSNLYSTHFFLSPPSRRRCKGFRSYVVRSHNNGRQAMLKMQNNAQSPTIVCDCVLFFLSSLSVQSRVSEKKRS